VKQFFKVFLASGLGLVSLAAVIVPTAMLTAQEPLESPALKESLSRFLQKFDHDKATKYIAAFADLNGDGIPEAIVYLAEGRWCGSGGCNTLILEQRGGSWQIVTDITITRPPIRVLVPTSNRWQNIGVWVQGGGIEPGYEAELRFDGKTYPPNPSVFPARRSGGSTAGRVVISLSDHAVPLYPGRAGAN
jgi:hypothetical protein